MMRIRVETRRKDDRDVFYAQIYALFLVRRYDAQACCDSSGMSDETITVKLLTE